MLTAQFFQTILPAHITQQLMISPDGVVSVELHLQSGMKYHLASFVDIAADALLADAYPEKGNPVRTSAQQQADGAGPFRYDRIAVAYGSISHIIVTATRASKTREFHI